MRNSAHTYIKIILSNPTILHFPEDLVDHASSRSLAECESSSTLIAFRIRHEVVTFEMYGKLGECNAVNRQHTAPNPLKATVFLKESVHAKPRIVLTSVCCRGCGAYLAGDRQSRLFVGFQGFRYS